MEGIIIRSPSPVGELMARALFDASRRSWQSLPWSGLDQRLQVLCMLHILYPYARLLYLGTEFYNAQSLETNRVEKLVG